MITTRIDSFSILERIEWFEGSLSPRSVVLIRAFSILERIEWFEGRKAQRTIILLDKLSVSSSGSNGLKGFNFQSPFVPCRSFSILEEG